MSRYTDEQTHHIMSSVHSKKHKYRGRTAKGIMAAGLSIPKKCENLAWKPDIVFTKYKLAIFCDSEFWHGKDWEVLRPKLSRGKNPDFWVKKIERNRQRDVDEERSLRAMGYTVLRFWGKDILSRPEECVQIIVDTLFEIKMQKYEDSIETELIKRDQESN